MDPLLLLKASLFLVATLGAAWLLRRAPASSRHGLWTFGFAAILLLPVVSVMLPALDVPVPASWRAILPAPASAGEMPAVPSGDSPDRIDVSRSPLSTESGRILEPVPSSVETPASDRASFSLPGLPQLLWGVWLAGVVAAVCTILLALWRTRRLARTAEELTELGWQQAAVEIGRRLDLRRGATLLVSGDVHTPMAGGFLQPVVYLPECARTWTADRRDVVLAHELAHAAGRDPLRHLVARLALSVYWFHPLAWLGARQAAMAREQACDEAVLALGTRRSDYARVLLELAESLTPAVRPLGALPMVEPSSLEKRLMTILDSDARPASRPALLWPAIGVVAFTLSVAVARPAAIAQIGAQIEPAAGPAAVAAPAAPAIPPAPSSAPAPQAQTSIPRDSACAWDSSSKSSSSGSTSYSSNQISTSSDGTRTVEQIGIRNGGRFIMKGFGSLLLCMVAEGLGDRTANERPSEWIGRARRVVLESRDGRDVQKMELTSGSSTPRVWQVNGADRAVDRAATDWRDRLLEVLDETWQIAMLRGEVSTLHGEISTMYGRRSTLQGEISTLNGQISTMLGRQSTIRGELGTLQGQISTLNGHVSSLQGAISSEQGAISSLHAQTAFADAAERLRISDRIARHNAEIARLSREIRDYNLTAKIAEVMRDIERLDVNGKTAAIDAEIRAFDLNRKVAAAEGRIRALDVDDEVAKLQRRIEALDADRRVLQMESRRDQALTRLQVAIKALGR